MTVENIGLPPWETEDSKALRKMVREFAQNEIAPKVEAMEKNEAVPREFLKEMGDLGLFGIPFDEKYGGSGLGKIGYCIFAEEFGEAHASTGVVVGAHVGLGCEAVNLFGTENQKQRYLVPGIKGEKIGALGATEQGAGSDLASMKTQAVKTDGGWTLNGAKQFITNGEIANFIIVFAQTNPKGDNKTVAAFIVDTDSTGFSFGKKEEKMGLHASRTNSIYFDNVFVPDANLLGVPGDGFKMVMRIFNHSRISLVASCVGMTRFSYQAALAYAQTRKFFGKPMLTYDNIKLKLAEIKATAEFIHSAVMDAAWKIDRGEEVRFEAATAKYLGPKLLEDAVRDALQLMGGYGYMKEYKVERVLRDIIVFNIFEGTSDIQLLTIAKDIPEIKESEKAYMEVLAKKFTK